MGGLDAKPQAMLRAMDLFLSLGPLALAIISGTLIERGRTRTSQRRNQAAWSLWSAGELPGTIRTLLLKGRPWLSPDRTLLGLLAAQEGQLEAAADHFLAASLQGLSPWLWPLLRRAHQNPDTLWARLLPRVPRLSYPGLAPDDWETRLRLADQAAEDPLFLDTLLLDGLRGIHGLAASVEPEGPRILFEYCLFQLLRRHGDPRIPWDRESPAWRCFHEGRLEEVLALVHNLPPESRPEGLWVCEVAALRRMGDLEGALGAAKEALEAFPNSARLWLDRHALGVEQGRSAEAARALEKAGSLLDPQAPPSLCFEWRLRAAEFAFFEHGNPEQAWHLFQDLPADWQGHHHPPLRLQLLVARSCYQEAYQELVKLNAQHPGDLDLLLLQGQTMAGLEAWEALPAFLDALGEGAHPRAEYWHLRGLALAHLQDLYPARESLERAAHLEPANLRMVLDAGHACLDLGEHDRAEQHWRQALRLAPQSEEALLHLADTRRFLHDPEGAKRLLRECLTHHPAFEAAQIALAELEAN